MNKSKPPYKGIRFFNLLLAIALFTICLLAPVTALAAYDVKLNVTSKSLVKDTSYSLRVYNLSETQSVEFTSDKPDVATVDSNGLVTAISNGTTSISVYIYDANKLVNTLTCQIKVGPPAISVRMTKSEVSLEQGKRVLLRTILAPYNTTEAVKFGVLNPTVATISSGGQVTAKAVGETYAFALINNGKIDFCKIIVTEAEVVEATTSETQASEVAVVEADALDFTFIEADASDIAIAEFALMIYEVEITISDTEAFQLINTCI